MANLYVWFDEKNRDRLLGRISELSRRHPGFREYVADGDPIQKLLDLLFPHGMPMDYSAANLSLNNSPEESLLLALRPVITPQHPWPFPKGCLLAARGYWPWPSKLSNPLFAVQDFLEVADSPLHSYERNLSVIVYQNIPTLQRTPRLDNVLTAELARELPPISLATKEKLADWNDFLVWKRKLVSEKTRGLRYIHRAWREDKLVFIVVAEEDQMLRDIYRAVSRQDVMAFELRVSTNNWTFRLNEQDSAKRAPRGYELGQPESLSQSQSIEDWLNKTDEDSTHLDSLRKHLTSCEWSAPLVAFVTVPLSEDDTNQLSIAEDVLVTQASLIEKIPEQGFLSVSAAGDLALIKRHEGAVSKLRDQGGFAPYLSSYLFDVKQANLPTTIEPIKTWFRDDLNEFQKHAVEKIVAAPDICLIQGPPGTGKTTVIAEAIMQLARRGERVLLASQAHTAVDNALERLGLHADLRAIRLARDLDKISGDGKRFVEQAALSRYYTGLANQTEERFLGPWHQTEARLAALGTWLETAEFLRRDLENAAKESSDFERELIRLKQARDMAWNTLQTSAQQYLDINQKREKFLALADFLREGSGDIPSSLDLPEPVTTNLANTVFELATLKARLPISTSDWLAVPGQRPQMLAGLLKFFRTLRAKSNEIENDVNRLLAAGPHSLRSPDAAVRLAAYEIEVKELEAKMEADTEQDDDLVQAWRRKRQEIKQLRSGAAGSLDPDLYSPLFLDSAYWCAPIENAQLIGEELRLRLEQIKTKRHAFVLAWKQMLDAITDIVDTCNAVAPDEADWRQREDDLQRHQTQSNRIEILNEQQRARVGPAINDSAVFSDPPTGQNDPHAALAGRIKECSEELDELRKAAALQRPSRSVWEPLLRDWVTDLKRPASPQADWEHFKDIFVPQCNVVAITCNEREQTLEDSGQISFDVAIIDEVSKATPLEMLLPLMRARRAVLVGDHRQLPPLFQEGTDAQTFSDVVEEAEEDSEDNKTSLTRHNLLRFEKMVTASLFRSHFESADDAIRARLEIQFRMHPQIMSLINHFYEQRLTCGLSRPDEQRAHRIELLDKDGIPIVSADDHVLWVDTSRNLDDQIHKEDMDAGGRPTRSNRLEAELIANTLVQLDKQCALSGYSPHNRRQIGVVSFYARQCRLIREEIRRVKPSGRFDCLDVEVNTVIRYQGKEKSIILVSLVRNDGYDPRNSAGVVRKRSSKANVARYEFINVAFSRAQELLIIFGARTMYDSYNVTLPNMDREGNVTRMVYKDILSQLDRDARLVSASRCMKSTGPIAAPRPSRSNEKYRGSRV